MEGSTEQDSALSIVRLQAAYEVMGSGSMFFADEEETPRAKRTDDDTDYKSRGKEKSMTLLERRRKGKTPPQASSSSKLSALRGTNASKSITEKTRLRLQKRPYGQENTDHNVDPLPSPTSLSRLPPAQQKLLLKYGRKGTNGLTSGEDEHGNLGSMSVRSVTPKTCNLKEKLIAKNAQNALVDSKQRLQTRALELRALKKDNVVNDRRRVTGSLKNRRRVNGSPKKSSTPNDVQRRALELRSLKKENATRNKGMSSESKSTFKAPTQCDKPYNKALLSNIRRARSVSFMRGRPGLCHAKSEGGHNDAMQDDWSNDVKAIQSCSFEYDENQSASRWQRKRSRAVLVKQFARKNQAGKGRKVQEEARDEEAN